MMRLLILLLFSFSVFAQSDFVTDDPRLNDYFKSYGYCYGVHWKLLRGIAYAESSLNPNIKCDKKYAGLFQISKNYCEAGIHKYSYLNCDNRCDVETNIAVATYHISKNLNRIKRACPSISLREQVLLLYVGHNNGPGVLKHVLNKGACDESEHPDAIRSFYDERGGSRNGVDGDYGVRKWEYGKKIVKKVEEIGATTSSMSIAEKKCAKTYNGHSNMPGQKQGDRAAIEDSSRSFVDTIYDYFTSGDDETNNVNVTR